MAKKNPTLDILQRAVKGLTFSSESDGALEAFLWNETGTLDDKKLRGLAGAEDDAAIEKDTLDDFFRTLPAEDKAKFDQLAKVIKEQLSGVKVYKIGDEAEKQVYVVGKTTDGQWAGIKTSVVET